MEALLVHEWLLDPETIQVRDEASLTSVRDRVRDVAAASSVDSVVAARAALVATELGRNQLHHAKRGLLSVLPLARPRASEPGVHRGIEIIAADAGGGIPDIRRALEGAPRVSGTLGVGLAMVRESSLEVDFDVRVGEGTCIRARIFEPHTPRGREVGIYGRPFPGEPVSGDHAYVWQTGRHWLAAVCDGLGHGPPAREAAIAAITAIRAQSSTSAGTLLEGCHRAMTPTRGAVMAVARIDAESSAFETAAMGNIAVQLTTHRRSRRFGGSAGVLGTRQAAVRVRSETASLEPGDVLILMTDGITTQLALEEEGDLLREHPIVIASEIVARFGRDSDDALVLVSR